MGRKDALKKSLPLAYLFFNYFFLITKNSLYSRVKMPGRSRSIVDDEENNNNNAGLVRVHAYKRRCPSKLRSRSPCGKKSRSRSRKRSASKKCGKESRSRSLKRSASKKCGKKSRSRSRKRSASKKCAKKLRSRSRKRSASKKCGKKSMSRSRKRSASKKCRQEIKKPFQEEIRVRIIDLRQKSAESKRRQKESSYGIQKSA